ETRTKMLRFLLEGHLPNRILLGKRAFEAVMRKQFFKYVKSNEDSISFPTVDAPSHLRLAFFSICARVVVAGDGAVDSEERESLRALERRLGFTASERESVVSYLTMDLKKCMDMIPNRHRLYLLAESFFLSLADSEQSQAEMDLL